MVIDWNMEGKQSKKLSGFYQGDLVCGKTTDWSGEYGMGATVKSHGVRMDCLWHWEEAVFDYVKMAVITQRSFGPFEQWARDWTA